MASLVSILILLEVILEVRTKDASMLSRWSFNPYFTGSNSGRKQYQASRLELIPVSILILLEVILEARTLLLNNITNKGFNPYFTGSNSGSFVSDSLWVNIFECFNPYFTGSNSGRVKFSYIVWYIKKFQSLFYWK